MATSKNKRKLQAPKVADKELSRIVDNIYDELNKVSSGASQGPTSQSIRFTSVNQSQLPPNPNFNNVSLDTLQFDTSYVSTELESQGTLYWNQDEETLSLVTNGETIELGQKIEVHVKNQTGSQIDKGEVVYASGTLGASGRILVTKMIADGTIAAKRILGVAAENIANGADGKVVKFGKIRKVDTSAYSNDDILWVSTTAAGAFQNTEPVQADGEIALPIAYVVYSSASNGEIFVRITPIDENEYQNYDAGLADIAGLTPTDSTIIVGNGTNWVAESGATALASLGAQAQDPQLDDIAGLTPTDGNFIVGNGSNFVAESGNTARTSLGLGTGDSPTFAGLTVNGNGLTANGAADLNSTLNVQGVLTTQDNILDDGFSEGWSGTNWQIQADGSAELQELRVRGALRVYEFIAKQISTIGGSEILSIAQGRVVSVNVGNETITVENVTGTAGNAFKANDLWICQVTDINNDLESGGTGSIVKSVRGTVVSVSGNDIVVTIDGGDITQLERGDLIIAYGNTSDADRQAIMYRNVDRSEDNLIMRLQTGITEFSKLQAVANTRVAFGDLNGYSGLSSETFGFFAGKNAEEHVLVTDTGIFFKDDLTIGAQLSSNVFKIGDNDNFLSFNTSNSSFEIKVDTFDLNTSFIQIADSIAKTSSALTSSVSYSGDLSLDGLFFDAENYFGYLTDVEALESNGYVFRVGEETSNFIEINSANGIAKINFDTFTLDATDANGGIKIDSDNELIQLEDANRVRTQVDVNNGTFSLTETVKYNADDETLILQSTPYQTGAIQITKGDSFYINIEAELITFGTLGDGDSAYITVEVYGGTTSGSQTNLISSYIGDDLDTVGQRNIVRFSAYSYLYEYINVKVIVNSNDGDLNGQFRLKENVVVKSYDSQTRVSLDGVYVNSSDNQYARLTRSANELVGILKLSGLPTKKPQTTGIVYNDNGTLKIS
jgi:hypothetical protein